MKQLSLFILCCIFCISILNAQTSNGSFAPELPWANNSTIYEVNLRQYTKEGNFNAFAQHLERLERLGVKILWFMPIQPIGVKNRKGSLGSYYAVKDYTGINPALGSKMDFKALVKKCHEMGFKVVIDWVANHSAPDNLWVKKHPDWYFHDSTGKVLPPQGTDWWDVAKLNYDKMDMRKAMIKSMEYYVKKFDIDGFRCDVAGDVPIDFWNEASQKLNNIKPVFMLAEWESPVAFSAFNMDYGWEFHHILTKIASGDKKLVDLDTFLQQHEMKYPATSIQMNFVTNHDENSWNGTIKEKFGPLGDAFTALTFVWPGMPLIYTGQESDLQRRLAFFDKDSIVWKDFPKQEFLSKLVKLKKENKALASINGGKMLRLKTPTDEAIYAFSRIKDNDQVLFFMNTTPNKTQVNFTSDLVSNTFTDIITGKKIILNKGNNEIRLPGFGFLILETSK